MATDAGGGAGEVVTAAQLAGLEVSSYGREGSYCSVSDPAFAESVALGVAAALSDYRGAVMDVGGYTPPYDDACLPAGYLALCFLAEGRAEHVVGVEFGQRDEGGGMVRAGFHAEASRRDPHNPHSSGIYAVNFDEAWRIVCLVARHLEIGRVTISYGC